MFVEVEVLRVVTKEVAKHIDHEKHRSGEVENAGYDSVPEALTVCFCRADRRDVKLH